MTSNMRTYQAFCSKNGLPLREHAGSGHIFSAREMDHSTRLKPDTGLMWAPSTNEDDLAHMQELEAHGFQHRDETEGVEPAIADPFALLPLPPAPKKIMVKKSPSVVVPSLVEMKQQRIDMVVYSVISADWFLESLCEFRVHTMLNVRDMQHLYGVNRELRSIVHPNTFGDKKLSEIMACNINENDLLLKHVLAANKFMPPSIVLATIYANFVHYRLYPEIHAQCTRTCTTPWDVTRPEINLDFCKVVSSDITPKTPVEYWPCGDKFDGDDRWGKCHQIVKDKPPMETMPRYEIKSCFESLQHPGKTILDNAVPKLVAYLQHSHSTMFPLDTCEQCQNLVILENAIESGVFSNPFYTNFDNFKTLMGYALINAHPLLFVQRARYGWKHDPLAQWKQLAFPRGPYGRPAQRDQVASRLLIRPEICSQIEYAFLCATILYPATLAEEEQDAAWITHRALDRRIFHSNEQIADEAYNHLRANARDQYSLDLIDTYTVGAGPPPSDSDDDEMSDSDESEEQVCRASGDEEPYSVESAASSLISMPSPDHQEMAQRGAELLAIHGPDLSSQDSIVTQPWQE